MGTLNGNYHEFTLENGLKVGLHTTSTQTVSGRLRVFHGSLHEKEGEEGLAHFLEHTVMVGGGRKYSSEQAEKLMNTFGNINAATNLVETRFMIEMIAEDLESYLDFISDVVFEPRLATSKVDQERQAVMREIADRKSRASFQDNQDFDKALYGLDSPRIYFGLGKEDLISRVSADDLKCFHQRG